MKRFLVLFFITFIFICVNSLFAQNAVTLNQSIENAAVFINNRIPAGTSIAVYNFSSDSRRLSEYIVDELTIALANKRDDVYDRWNLDEVNREIFFSQTDAVNEDTAAAYGENIGAQVVILGSIIKASDTEYRLRVQAIVTETKRIQAASTFNVRQDNQLLSLLGIQTQTNPWVYGGMNIVFGLGSFQMGDPLGGGTVLVLEAASLTFLILGLVNAFIEIDHWNAGEYGINYREYEYKNSWGNVIKPSSDFDAWINSTEYVNDINKKQEEINDMGRTFIIIGGIGFASAVTWGFVRPFMYDKPRPVQTIANVIDHLNIGLVPSNSGNPNVFVSLNYSF